MGLDYSYMMVIEDNDKERALSYVDQLNVIKRNFDNCISIDFKLDKTISAFLKQSIKQTNKFRLIDVFLFKKTRFRDHFPGNNIGRIGCIYLGVTESQVSRLTYLRFTAATTSMSMLFQESKSIKGWFVDFSKEVNSIVTFIDLEEQGYRFIYHESSEVDVLILPNGSNYQASSRSIYSEISLEYESMMGGNL